MATFNMDEMERKIGIRGITRKNVSAESRQLEALEGIQDELTRIVGLLAIIGSKIK